MRPQQISDTQINEFIVAGLREDIGTGDHTSLATIPADNRSRAVLKIKDYGVLAGVDLAERIFRHLDPDAKLTIHKPDGSDVLFGEIGFEVEANTRALLQGERLALNTMQRMSGIATLSSRFAFEVGDLPVTVLDTRKTTPLIRFLEKWAVKIGGCENYRWGLYDWMMIKDNHVDAAGGIRNAVERAHAYQKEKGLNLGITVEVRNLVELEELMQVGGITRVMFDNFEIPILHEAVAIVNGRFETEASGGITLFNVRKYAQTGVNYVSAGALTHSAHPLDMSLKIVRG
ncbi:MAG: carboxylating nicotinate-nucleotide diphosphorylase [Haliscomenobacteraceae bacterium CHB4]|nr:putative nicotinate-nucleotide pyrophosphorylase [carboxylating] [Saprospiraceae bacterium]MCE7921458.1 carboxylating nicotinate-nucleotide diphosphorylase [Haliscomenobacteraceae bacterium CHB4]